MKAPGERTVTLRKAGQVPIETGLGMRMGAVGATGTLLDGSGASGVGVKLKSDAMWVRTESDATTGLKGATGDVSRLRLGLAADRTFETGTGGGTLTSSAEVGLRHDGGDAETGTGVEVGAQLRYAAGALVIEGAVRTLLAHEESGYEEWGASGAIRLAPSASGRGLSLSVARRWMGPFVFETGLAPHFRELRLDWSNDSAWSLKLDQGVGYWRCRPSAEYPFSKTPSEQLEALNEIASRCRVASLGTDPTYVYAATV